MDLIEKKLSSEDILQMKVFSVSKDTALLPNGRKAERDVIHHNGGVGIIPLTQDNKIYLVKQFRYPFEAVLTEIPAGKKEIGEEPIDCGKRELSEETGCMSDSWISLGKLLPTPAYDTEITYLFLARDVKKINGQKLDSDEFVNIIEMSLDTAYEKVMNGELSDAKTQIAILKTYNIIHNIGF